MIVNEHPLWLGEFEFAPDAVKMVRQGLNYFDPDNFRLVDVLDLILNLTD